MKSPKRWATVLDRLCGRCYPNFYLSTFRPMIRSVEDVNEHKDLWNTAFALFSHRADLAAGVRSQIGMP